MAERHILGALLSEPHRWHNVQQSVHVEDFTDAPRRRLAEVYWAHQRDEGEPVFNEFLGLLRDDSQATPLEGAEAISPEQLIELAYPPFSCALSLAGDAPIETTNITGFTELRANDVCDVDLDLLNGFGHTPYPADLRPLAAVERERRDVA
jgi:hypothetical protein